MKCAKLATLTILVLTFFYIFSSTVYANIIIFILKRYTWNASLRRYFMLFEYWVVCGGVLFPAIWHSLPGRGSSWSCAIYDSYAWKCIKSKPAADYQAFLMKLFFINASCIKPVQITMSQEINAITTNDIGTFLCYQHKTSNILKLTYRR